MTTNQTIDGVPGLRELLERVATEANHMLGFTYAANYDECRNAVDELRALLDAPDKSDYLQSCEAAHNALEPAAQLQGEPVYQLSSAYARPPEWTDQDKESYDAYTGRDGWITRILYAEQPAPVAVMMPDQKSVSALVTKAARKADLINGANYYTAAELAAEAVINEVTRLNAKSR